jgi:hypothetical protein
MGAQPRQSNTAVDDEQAFFKEWLELTVSARQKICLIAGH